MQGHYAAAFDREMGCTADELVHWLPGASRGRPVAVAGQGARVTIDTGQLDLTWQTLPPRRIALLQMPCLAVSFRFAGIDDAARQAFMRYFDLYTQRGGG